MKVVYLTAFRMEGGNRTTMFLRFCKFVENRNRGECFEKYYCSGAAVSAFGYRRKCKEGESGGQGSLQRAACGYGCVSGKFYDPDS